MKLYRAVSPAELADIQSRGGFHAGWPSHQGKWFAESCHDAEEWGKRLYPQPGDLFHVVEVDVATSVADQFFRLANLDGIGPARFADVNQLPMLNQAASGICEVTRGFP